MSNHGLTRNADNEPVCILCGYRPAILDEAAPVGKQWKARTAVLDHAKALNDAEAANEWEAALDAHPGLGKPPTKPAPLRSPDAPFVFEDARYPRAGVRQTDDGRWRLTFWDGDHIVHVFADPIFSDRVEAFDVGQTIIGACRDSGTNLNGLEAA